MSKPQSYLHPCRGARVALVTHDDGSVSPEEVFVTLHSAGMLVEREIVVPDPVRGRHFASADAAAKAAIGALELDSRIVPWQG
jgi:hypothetical protein